MASFVDSVNAYDPVLMDKVVKKYSSTSLNHFKSILLPRPDDLQKDCYCSIEKMNPPGCREEM